MSKYIIEIAKEYEEYFKGILICGIVDGKFAVDVIAREDLEELNSDYINEHYGSLQDEAYKRGINDGSLDVKQRVEGAYQRGFDDGKDSVMLPCDGCKWDTEDGDGAHCKRCSRNCLDNYEEKQKEEDDIKLGDVLEHTVSGYTSKAIFLKKIEDDEDWYTCLFWTGCGLAILSYPKSQFKRIGKHFDIDKILEEMKE